MSTFRILVVLLLFCSLALKAQDPDPPLITYLSVNPNSQQVEINWVNSSSQVVGYIIYFKDISGLWIPLDTINGINNTQYITTNANPQNQIETYSVVAFDNFGNSSIRSEAHSTIYLNSNYTECDTLVSLNWNHYLNMVGMNSYQLKSIKEDLISGIIYPMDSIDISQQDTSFLYPVDYSSNYTFWLEAKSNITKSSLSNKIRINVTNIDIPSFSYINKVSVIGENKILINALSNSDDISHINIYRSYSPDGFQFFIGQANKSANNIYNLTDQLVLPERNLYYYRANPVDICGKEYQLPKYDTLSNQAVVHNLKLSPLTINKDKISVLCDKYDGFLNSSHMELWKESNQEKVFIQNAYENNDYQISISNDYGNVCLYIISIEDDLNILNRKDTIYSNRVCISKPPLLHIPTAFTPQNGDIKNDSWKIMVGDEASIKSFKLTIFNRFGVPIFETNSIHHSWNGEFNNKPAPDGIYIYHVELSYGQEQFYQYRGSIYLVR